MYLKHFGLSFAPYRITPDTALFYGGAERGMILDALVYVITTGEAITKVVGEVGSGKTMLCRMLEQKVPQNVEIVYLANPSLPPENVLHAIAFELGLPIEGESNRLLVMKMLQNYLLQRHSESKQVVVFVEEAQGMPLATLEEIRLLSNLETQHHKLLQVVLFGQPELDEGLKTRGVRQIKERITHSFNLSPLRRREIGDYLAFRLRLAGYRGKPVFTWTAITLISCFSTGLMRRINILADKAMLAAYTADSHMVTSRHVIAALSDCEFSHRTVSFMKASTAALLIVFVLGIAAWQLMGKVINPPSVVSALMMTAPLPEKPRQTKAFIAQDSVMGDNLLGHRIDATHQWLTQSTPEHFTIQVLWAKPRGEDSVIQFLQQTQQAGVLEQLFVYREGGMDSGALNVVYGEYVSYSAAQDALTELPEILLRYGPYLRNVSGVMKDALASGLAAMDN